MLIKFMYYNKSDKELGLYREITFDCVKIDKIIEDKKIEYVLTTKGNFLEYPDASIQLDEYNNKSNREVEVYFMNDDGKTIDHYIYS